MKEYKIIITGTVGAGKTTAIGAVSEIPPLVTDVLNFDSSLDKEKTTVGLDYGEVTLNNKKVKLYGTPGQKRFDFMWEALAQGASGIIILIDHTSDDSAIDLDLYASSFKKLTRHTPCVVALSKYIQKFDHMDCLSKVLKDNQVTCPIVPVDIRQKSQVLWLLDLLLTQLEDGNE